MSWLWGRNTAVLVYLFAMGDQVQRTEIQPHHDCDCGGTKFDDWGRLQSCAKGTKLLSNETGVAQTWRCT